MVETEHIKFPGVLRHPKERWPMKQKLNPQQLTQVAKRSFVFSCFSVKRFSNQIQILRGG